MKNAVSSLPEWAQQFIEGLKQEVAEQKELLDTFRGSETLTMVNERGCIGDADLYLPDDARITFNPLKPGWRGIEVRRSACALKISSSSPLKISLHCANIITVSAE